MLNAQPHPSTSTSAQLMMTGKKPSAKVTQQKLNILLVEDVSSDCLLTKKALDDSGIPYKLSTLSRGDDALNSLKSDSTATYDLIMLDLGLPGIDGFEMLAQLAAMPAAKRSVPIIILTAHQDFEYIQNNFPLCILGYLTKPCCPEKMLKLLEHV